MYRFTRDALTPVYGLTSTSNSNMKVQCFSNNDQVLIFYCGYGEIYLFS